MIAGIETPVQVPQLVLDLVIESRDKLSKLLEDCPCGPRDYCKECIRRQAKYNGLKTWLNEVTKYRA